MVTITIAPPTTPLEKLALHYFAIRTISSSTAVVYVVKSPNIDQIADPNLPDSSAITSNIFPALSSSPESTVQSLIMPSTFLSTAVSSPASSITASPPEMTDNQYFRGSRDFIFYLLARDNGTPRRLTSRARVTIRVLDVNDMPPMISINYLNVPNSFPSTSSSPGGLRFPVNSAYRTSQTASSDGYSSFYLKPAPEVSFRQASEPALVTSGTNRGYLVENRARALVAFVSVRDYDSGDWGRVRCHTDNEAFTLVPMLSSQSFPSTSRTVQTETRVNRVAMDLFGSNKGGTLGSENIPGSLGSLARDPNLNGPVMDANQEAGYKLMATKALDREETPEVMALEISFCIKVLSIFI
ncbi:unnamed protein product [Protopolystoma xenopodis]|uniref:Cadherin domain-containing protein n=1 Tax=Protopolystoma xenopodis TaxID=117903 RepID=A0A3S5FBL2_9PLAT|nr:unnamed protein product [Protopolystoma xenopodis]